MMGYSTGYKLPTPASEVEKLLAIAETCGIERNEDAFYDILDAVCGVSATITPVTTELLEYIKSEKTSG